MGHDFRAGWSWGSTVVRAELLPVPPDPAVTVLYRDNALKLTRMAHIMLGNRAAAEDVVHDAFCGLYPAVGAAGKQGQGACLRAVIGA